MKPMFRTLLLLVVLASGAVGAISVQASERPAYAAGQEIIFKIKTEQIENNPAQAAPLAAASQRNINAEDKASSIAEKYGLGRVYGLGNVRKPGSKPDQRAAKQAVKQVAGAASVPAQVAGKNAVQASRIYKAGIGKGQNADAVISALAKDPAIEWAEPNAVYKAHVTTPDDADYSRSQQIMNATGVDRFWDYQQGSEEVIIAVIDTGVDYTHPDLVNNIWINTGEIPDDGIDNDNNGFVDDVRGWDFVTASASEVHPDEDPAPMDNDPMDVAGHGTHVAGIIAAEGNNSLGIAGVSWRSKIMPVRAGYKKPDGFGLFYRSDILESLYYACGNNADIVNMSLGSPASSRAYEDVLAYCDQQNVLVVASAGNDGTSDIQFPAAYSRVLAVAASMDANDRLTGFSNYGIWVDIAAPGHKIYSTVIGGGYEEKSGTSMASPFVAGMAALIKSQNPGMSAKDIRAVLVNQAESPVEGVSLTGGGFANMSWPMDLSVMQSKAAIVSLSVHEQTTLEDFSFQAGERLLIKPTVRNFGREPETVSLTLLSDDPYISIADSSVVLGKLMPDRKRTEGNDTFIVDVASGVPANYRANIRIRLHNDAGMLSETQYTLELNRYFKTLTDGSPVSRAIGYRRPRLFEHANGDISYLYKSQVAEDVIYHRIRNSHGHWSDAQALPMVGNQDIVHFEAAMDNLDRLHLVFSTDTDLQYAVYDGQWQVSVIDPEARPRSYDLKLSLSPEADVVIVWIEFQNGDPMLKQLRKQSGSWSPTETIASFPGMRIFDLEFARAKNGDEVLFWRQPDAGSFSGELMYAALNSGQELAPVSLTRINSILDVLVDSESNIHLAYHAESGGRYHRSYDGAGWSPQNSLPTFNGGLLQGPGGVEWLYETSDTIERIRLTGEGWSAPETFHLLAGKEEFLPASSQGDLLYTNTGEALLATVTDYPGKGIYSINLYSSSSAGDRVVPKLIPQSSSEQSSELSAVIDNSLSGMYQGFKYAVGSAPGESDLLHWRDGSFADAVLSIPDHLRIKPVAGQEYYVSTRATGASGYRSAVASADGITYVEPTGMISPVDGDTLSAYSETFSWHPVAGNNGYLLRFGTTPGGNELGVHFVDGSETGFTKTELPMDGSTVYVALAWSTEEQGLVIEEYEYTSATWTGMITPADGSTFANSSQTFTWEAVPGNSGYLLKFGSAYDGNDLGVHFVESGTTSFTKTDLPMDGSTIYVSLSWSTDVYGLVTLEYEYTSAIQAGITSPVDGTVLNGGTQTFEWVPVPDNNSYLLKFGSSPGGLEYGIHVIDPAVNAFTKSDLPTDGSVVYVTLAWSSSDMAGLAVRNYSYTAFQAQTAAPQMLSPVSGATLESDTQAFTWAPVPDASGYLLRVGSTGEGSSDLGEVILTDSAATDYSFAGLPTDGSTLYVMLRVLKESGEMATSHYTYTAATVLQAPVLEVSFRTSWTGATTTLSWRDAPTADIYRNNVLYAESSSENPMSIKTWWSNTRYNWKACLPGTDVCSENLQ